MFTRDGQLLQCKVHGALFEISSGEGLGGPCRNQALTRLEVSVEDGNVIFTGAVLPRVPEVQWKNFACCHFDFNCDFRSVGSAT